MTIDIFSKKSIFSETIILKKFFDVIIDINFFTNALFLLFFIRRCKYEKLF
tara:strand:+ start:541 stop:693 length:153 start_codon:yes stop_codon:yes gene_type:complete